MQLPYIPRAAQLVWTAAGHWTIWWALLLLIQGLLPVATVYLTRHLVDTLSRTLGVGESPPAWQQRAYEVIRRTAVDHGGHFPGLDATVALAGDIASYSADLANRALTG